MDDYAGLLRASITSQAMITGWAPMRLRPPSYRYSSVNLNEVLTEIKTRVGDKFSEQDEILLKLDIHKNIPELLLDNTDRNRTSPFAFTGNKFEFRAVGSTANCGIPMTTLNAIMAKTLTEFKKEVDALIDKGDKKEIAIMQVIREYIKSSEKVLFEGDGYSEEWEREERAPNVKTTPTALMQWLMSCQEIVRRPGICSF